MPQALFELNERQRLAVLRSDFEELVKERNGLVRRIALLEELRKTGCEKFKSGAYLEISYASMDLVPIDAKLDSLRKELGIETPESDDGVS